MAISSGAGVSFLDAIASVEALQEDARLLAAEARLAALEEQIHNAISCGALQEDSDECQQIRERIKNINPDKLRDRCRRVRDALVETTADIGEEWILGSHLFGVTTHYQVEGDGNLLIRMEGTQDNLPFFDLVAVAYEVALFNTWVPLCSRSDLLWQEGKCEFVVDVNLSAPFPIMMSRDLVMHAFAAECLSESGSVVVLARSVDSFPGVNIPPVSKSFLHDRGDVKTLKICVKCVSATSAKIVLISKVDVKVPLPQSIVNFFIKKFAGVFLYILQNKAIEVHNSSSCPHIDAVHRKPEFYGKWILPVMKEYFRAKGWGDPPLPSYLPLVLVPVDSESEIEKR